MSCPTWRIGSRVDSTCIQGVKDSNNGSRRLGHSSHRRCRCHTSSRTSSSLYIIIRATQSSIHSLRLMEARLLSLLVLRLRARQLLRRVLQLHLAPTLPRGLLHLVAFLLRFVHIPRNPGWQELYTHPECTPLLSFRHTPFNNRVSYNQPRQTTIRRRPSKRPSMRWVHRE